MFFKKKKEIERLSRELDDLRCAQNALQGENDTLRRKNDTLQKDQKDDYVDPCFCAECTNGIVYRDFCGYTVGVECALSCKCKNFNHRA